VPAQLRLDQIRDLVNQWEQLSGYMVAVPDWAINEMADGWAGKEIASLYDVGTYMAGHWDTTGGHMGGGYFVNIDLNAVPWAKWGMTTTEYDMKRGAFDSTFRTLTGQTAPQDLIDQALHEHQGIMSGSQFNTWLMAQDSIKNQYGWLRYGLDFNQFQTQKLQMRTGFGRDLTDAEAVTQLQYLHTSQGPNVGVTAQQTLGQVEKKQAQTGLSGSVVR
jgi:hypothetical protein